jgi:hypothetical protein
VKLKPWKIELTPTKDGLSLKCRADLRDEEANFVNQYLAKCLLLLLNEPSNK